MDIVMILVLLLVGITVGMGVYAIKKKAFQEVKQEPYLV